jgi:hypothetical protein
MNFKGYDEEEQIEAFLSKYMNQLVEDYNEWIDYMQDSEEHKNYLRNSDKCFEEWVADKYFESLETV